jgi:hypothetical protein
MEEQVCRDHRHAQSGRCQSVLEAGNDCVPLGCAGAERYEIVVVESDAPGPDLGKLVHRMEWVEGRPSGLSEGIAGLPPDGPHAERELVGGCAAHATNRT